jgi:hypothetical protein
MMTIVTCLLVGTNAKNFVEKVLNLDKKQGFSQTVFTFTFRITIEGTTNKLYNIRTLIIMIPIQL